MHLKIKFFIGFFLCFHVGASQILPEGFTVLTEVIPELSTELRYASSSNFMGRPVKGYVSSKAIGTIAMAIQLKKVQDLLKTHGVGLKIYDAYRPQTAVNDFIEWSQLSQDTLMKRYYYPQLSKNTLFQKGFIAKKSGHSRGSSVDLTLVYTSGDHEGEELDMGGTWDFFGERSSYLYSKLTQMQKENRKLLRDAMITQGFKPYDKEWWHFTLIQEPFPNTYFDFILTP